MYNTQTQTHKHRHTHTHTDTHTHLYCYYDNLCYSALLKKHSGEELDKIKAAISALKSPLLADDVELESSPAPFYFGYNAAGNEALSRSVPMLADTQYDDDDSIPGTPDPRHMRQGKVISFICKNVMELL